MAQGLYDISRLQPLIEEGYILLTPNYRLARRIKAQWDAHNAAAGKRVWLPVSVLPLEHWLLAQWELAVSLDLLPPLTPLNPAQILELWRQVISAQERLSPDYHLLRPAAAAELASQARDTLLRWQVDSGARDTAQLFELQPDCATFLHWQSAFEQRLAKAGLCTAADCLAQLPGLRGHLPTSRVALVECEDIAPLQRAALQALSEQTLDFLPLAEYGDRLVHDYSEKRAELQAVAAWAANLHRASPAATIGIVLGDMRGDRVAMEYLLRREFDCLGENYTSLPVNFSTGIPLAHAPLVRDALAALAMCLQRTTVPAVVRLMRSRYLDLPDAQGALAQRFIKELFAAGSEVVDLAEIRRSANAASLGADKGLWLGRQLLALQRMRELRRRALPSVWGTHFRAVLSQWGWPGRQALDSLEYQQLDLWYRTLDEFSGFDGVCRAIDFGAALDLLRDCCTRQISQPETADSPVQVLGPLEAAGLSFDHLWLCGMQAANWPAAPRPSPFIPVSLQTRMHMPHASQEREWAFGDTLLRQYARSSEMLHASYSRQTDGVADLPSPLLQEFTPQTMPESTLIAARWTDSCEQVGLERVSDPCGPPLDREQKATISGGSLLLEDQSQCPFRAFARHRLQVEPLPPFNAALSAGDRGSLLHNALCTLWCELRDLSSLLALCDAQLEQTVRRAIQACIATVDAGQKRRMVRAYWRLEEQRLTALLLEWLSVERLRSDFSVVALEHEIALELTDLPLHLRVDRIDQLPDGSRVIIDYKSGASSVQDWLGDRPARPQLLLYSIAEPNAAAALAFAQVRRRDCRFIGLGRVAAAPGISTDIPGAVKAQMDAQDWPALNERWGEILERLAQSFAAGAASVAPLTPSVCMHCGLQPLCRIELHTELTRAETE